MKHLPLCADIEKALISVLDAALKAGGVQIFNVCQQILSSIVDGAAPVVSSSAPEELPQ